MEPKWHKLKFPCPKCDKPCAIMELCIHSDCIVLMEGLCVTCGHEVSAKFGFGMMLKYAIQADLDDSFYEPEKDEGASDA